MFDKNEDYAVLTVNQVCCYASGKFINETKTRTNETCRFCPCRLDRMLFRHLALLACKLLTCLVDMLKNMSVR